MGQKQAVRSNLRQSKRRRTGVLYAAGQPSRSRCQSPSPLLLFRLFLKLFQRHTGVLWLVVGALLVGTTTAAVMTIVDPTASLSSQSMLKAEPHTHSVDQPSNARNIPVLASPQGSHQPVTSAESHSTQTTSPLSVGGMLLLSCAGGCFFLSQWLKPQPAAKRSAKPGATVGRKNSRKKTARSTQPRASSKSKSRLNHSTVVEDSSVSTQLTPAETTHTVKQSQLSNRGETVQMDDRTLRQPSPTSDPVTEVAVTVMPHEQSHPLDWDEPSLADNLDLRQQRPLSYWF